MPMQSSNNKEKTPIEKVFLKYSYSKYALALSLEYWEDILFRGNINQNIITTKLNNSKYFMDERTESWQKLLAFRDLEDDEFKEFLEDMVQNFYLNKYKEYGKLLHATALLIYFSKNKMLDKTISEIKKQVKKNIKDSANLFALEEVDRYATRSAYGCVYYDEESKDFRDIYNYFIQERQKAFKKSLSKKSNELLLILKDDTMKSFQDKFEKEFLYVPIFSSMDSEIFINVVQTMKHKDFMNFRPLIEDRYRYDNNELVSELKFWKSVSRKIIQGIDRKKTPVKYSLLLYFKEYTIKSILKKLELEKKKI